MQRVSVIMLAYMITEKHDYYTAEKLIVISHLFTLFKYKLYHFYFYTSRIFMSRDCLEWSGESRMLFTLFIIAIIRFFVCVAV